METETTPASSTIGVDVLSVFMGHASITIQDDDPAKRKELADHIKQMRRDGFAIFLEHEGVTHLIDGYDADKNDWLVKPKGKGNHKPKLLERIAAKSAKRPTAVAQQAGG